MTTIQSDDFGLDRALDPKDAVEKDRLNRKGFAKQVVNALKPLSARSSIVVSIEGAWGSGKSSILAMAEELLEQEADKPIIVHFNPWLIGDRNALLQQFLSSLAKELELIEVPHIAKQIADAMKKYSTVFEVVKYVPLPGTELAAKAWSTATGAFAKVGESGESSEPDIIEARKRKLEDALKGLPQRVVVLIDDMDRLYPSEVFEIIRIIKAVADLPNVGYILAFDASYITDALSALQVPKAAAYLDKIVQTRLVIPVLSPSAKQELMLAGLNHLPTEARKSHFDGDQALIADIYHSGLRDILEQPRDFARLFNVVNALEPELRGEIVFADILGLAALMIKAAPVFELLRKSPKAFVGQVPRDIPVESGDEAIKAYKDEREKAYEKSSSVREARRLVHFLFPQVAKSDDRPYMSGRLGRGRLAQSARLVVALQFALTGADVSFRQIRRFIESTDSMEDVAATLTPENCQDFLELFENSISDYQGLQDDHAHSLAINVARLVDSAAFVQARRDRSDVLMVPAQNTAILAIRRIGSGRGVAFLQRAARDIACDTLALTVAADLISNNKDERNPNDEFFLSDQDLEGCRSTFVKNILLAIADGSLFGRLYPGLILFQLSLSIPERCPDIMDALRQKDPSLDDFASEFFKSSYDSSKGQQYALPRKVEELTAFGSLEFFEQQAKKRLDDPQMQYPVRAAWRCVVEKKAIYGVDGSDAR